MTGQIEAARVAISRHVKRKGKLWIRISRTSRSPRSRPRPAWARARAPPRTGSPSSVRAACFRDPGRDGRGARGVPPGATTSCRFRRGSLAGSGSYEDCSDTERPIRRSSKRRAQAARRLFQLRLKPATNQLANTNGDPDRARDRRSRRCCATARTGVETQPPRPRSRRRRRGGSPRRRSPTVTTPKTSRRAKVHAPRAHRHGHDRQDGEDGGRARSTVASRARLYHKYLTRRAKYKAHDENNGCQIGDRSSIVESRPLSTRSAGASTLVDGRKRLEDPTDDPHGQTRASWTSPTTGAPRRSSASRSWAARSGSTPRWATSSWSPSARRSRTPR